jgi:predicted nucleic acid-binding protein
MAAGSLLLDTNVVVLLCRGGHAGRQLDRRYSLRSRRDTPSISAVTLGETLALAKSNAWGEQKQSLLRELLERLVVVDVQNELVLAAYADVYVYANAAGRRMGQNDMWIAASAMATGLTLLTTDTDFDVLHPALLVREYADPRTLQEPKA